MKRLFMAAVFALAPITTMAQEPVINTQSLTPAEITNTCKAGERCYMAWLRAKNLPVRFEFKASSPTGAVLQASFTAHKWRLQMQGLTKKPIDQFPNLVFAHRG